MLTIRRTRLRSYRDYTATISGFSTQQEALRDREWRLSDLRRGQEGHAAAWQARRPCRAERRSADRGRAKGRRDCVPDDDGRFGGISEIALNSALAMIEAAAPKDEIEGALAVQMACTHMAAMSILARFDSCMTEKRTAIYGVATARLLRTYAMQVETLRRLRHGGSQFVRVEHVHVSDGGQAVIGNVTSTARSPASEKP
jgi:hypothetical protein